MIDKPETSVNSQIYGNFLSSHQCAGISLYSSVHRLYSSLFLSPEKKEVPPWLLSLVSGLMIGAYPQRQGCEEKQGKHPSLSFLYFAPFCNLPSLVYFSEVSEVDSRALR